MFSNTRTLALARLALRRFARWSAAAVLVGAPLLCDAVAARGAERMPAAAPNVLDTRSDAGDLARWQGVDPQRTDRVAQSRYFLSSTS